MRHFLLCLFLFPLCLACRREPRPPNIVILFADDLGYGDLGAYGNDTIRTPNLDRLAREGALFTDFYAASPACTASRYALLTGRYPVYSGLDWVLYPRSARGIHRQERTLAEYLQEAGYATACFGKWHLGTADTSFLPLQNGFDEYLGLPYSNDMLPPRHPALPLIEGNDTLELNPDQGALTGRYTERAIAFIRRCGNRPFLLYLPYAMPHVPLHPGPAFAGRSPRGPYGDAVEEIDWSVGEIARVLKETGLDRHTLLWFASDNGPWIIKGRDGGSAGPLRDGKGSTWEGGMRVPAIAWWPGHITPGRRITAPASTLDVLPTVLSATGLPSPGQVDGQDIGRLMLQPLNEQGGAENTTDEASSAGETALAQRPFFYHGPGHRLQAVRRGPWKLHLLTNSQTGVDYFDGHLPLLFNLEQDPGETTDLAASHPEIVAELTGLLAKHRRRIGQDPGFWERDRQARREEHIAFRLPVTFSPPLPPGADSVLTDGLPGNPDAPATFVQVGGPVLQATIDLGEPLLAEQLGVGFLHAPLRRVFLPEYVEFFISEDGKSFKSRGRLHLPDPSSGAPDQVVPFTVLMRAQPLRYVRLVAHSRVEDAVGQAWMLVDEIRVE